MLPPNDRGIFDRPFEPGPQDWFNPEAGTDDTKPNAEDHSGRDYRMWNSLGDGNWQKASLELYDNDW